MKESEIPPFSNYQALRLTEEMRESFPEKPIFSPFHAFNILLSKMKGEKREGKANLVESSKIKVMVSSEECAFVISLDIRKMCKIWALKSRAVVKQNDYLNLLGHGLIDSRNKTRRL